MADDDNGDGLEQETTAASERPEWLPAKYETPEAFAKAHGELEQTFGRQSQELGEIRGEFETMQEQMAQLQQAPPQYDNGENPLVAAYSRAFEEGDITGMLAVQAQIAQAVAQQSAPPPTTPDVALVAQFAENQVRAANSDYDQYRDDTVRILQENPNLIPEGANLVTVQNGITAALEVARGRALHQQAQTDAQKTAQQEAARLAKLNSQAVPSGGTRPQSVDQQSDVWERIKNANPGGFRVPSGN